VAIFVMRDRPSDMGLYPDGAPDDQGHVAAEPHDYHFLLRQSAFWLLVISSLCSIGSIGAINQHMKLVFEDQGFREQRLLNQVFSDALFLIMISSIGGRIIMGWLADRLPKKFVMLSSYILVAATIPLLLMVKPPGTPVVFSVLFGFGMGADYMLIPLMAAEQFGANTLARAMGVILPVSTIGQTWFPYGVSLLREHFGDYEVSLWVVFALSGLGALAVGLLPRYGRKDETLHLHQPGGAAARR
jgi:MFS family permease